MASYKHEAIIVTCDTYGAYEAIKAFSETMPEGFRHYFVGPVVGANGYATFVLAPDGIGESSGPGTVMDAVRSRFIALLMTLRVDWAHVILRDETETYRAGEPRRPRIAASSMDIDPIVTGYEPAKPNLWELKEYEIRDGETQNLLASYRSEEEAYATVAKVVKQSGAEAVHTWALTHLRNSIPKLLAAGDKLAASALWREEQRARFVERKRQLDRLRRGEDGDSNNGTTN